MARYPGATWKPIGDGGGEMARYDLVILHTMAGNLTGTDSYFRNATPNNSHFGVGGKWGADATNGLDGKVWQWVDTAKRSAASRDGNARSISVECADNTSRPIEPWTPSQQMAIIGLMVWAHRTHDIPLQLATDSRPTTRGIAYHRLGCDPYRATGGELWSSAFGKDCPTDARISQIPELIDRAQATLDGTADQEKDLDATEHDWLQRILDDTTALRQQFNPKKAGSLVDKVNRGGDRVSDVQDSMLAGIASAAASNAALTAAVKTLQAGGGNIDMDALNEAMRQAAEQGAADALARVQLSVRPDA